MKMRSFQMLGGAAWMLLTAMPVVGQETEGARAPPELAAANDVVGPAGAGEVDPFSPDSGALGGVCGARQIRAVRGTGLRHTMRLRTEVWEVPAIEFPDRPGAIGRKFEFLP